MKKTIVGTRGARQFFKKTDVLSIGIAKFEVSEEIRDSLIICFPYYYASLTDSIPQQNQQALCDLLERFLESDETRLDLRTEPLAQSETGPTVSDMVERISRPPFINETDLPAYTPGKSLIPEGDISPVEEQPATVELGSLPVGAKFELPNSPNYGICEIKENDPDDWSCWINVEEQEQPALLLKTVNVILVSLPEPTKDPDPLPVDDSSTEGVETAEETANASLANAEAELFEEGKGSQSEPTPQLDAPKTVRFDSLKPGDIFKTNRGNPGVTFLKSDDEQWAVRFIDGKVSTALGYFNDPGQLVTPLPPVEERAEGKNIEIDGSWDGKTWVNVFGLATDGNRLYFDRSIIDSLSRFNNLRLTIE